VPSLEFQLLVGCIHGVASVSASTKAVKQCVRFLRMVVIVLAQGNKSTLMKGKRDIEQRGPLGKTIPRKTTTNLHVGPQQWCPFHINIYYYKSDGHYYLSTNGNVQNFHTGMICSHRHHERQMVVFSSHTYMDGHVEKRN
jgi:hypothetical protein